MLEIKTAIHFVFAVTDEWNEFALLVLSPHHQGTCQREIVVFEYITVMCYWSLHLTSPEIPCGNTFTVPRIQANTHLVLESNNVYHIHVLLKLIGTWHAYLKHT